MSEMRMKTLTFLCAVVWLCSSPAALAQKQERPDKTIAKMSVKDDVITWKPQVEYDYLVLTVSGPYDHVRHQFKSGQQVAFRPVNQKGEPLPDGQYTFELRLIPVFGPEVSRALKRASEMDDREAVEREVMIKGKIPRRARTESGVFTLKNGKFISPDVKEKEDDTRC